MHVRELAGVLAHALQQLVGAHVVVLVIGGGGAASVDSAIVE